MIIKEEYSKNYRNHYKNIQKVYPSVFSLKIFLGNNPYFSLKDVDFKDKTILDIGFGDGRDLILFNDLGFKTYGIEVDKDVVEHTKKKFDQSNINISVGSNDKTGFENNYFDFVYAIASLMYFRNKNIKLSEILNHIYKIMCKDGYFIGTFTNADSHITKESTSIDSNRIILKDPFYKQRLGQIYYIHHSKEEVEKDLSKVGFRDILISSYEADWFGTKEKIYIFVARK